MKLNLFFTSLFISHLSENSENADTTEHVPETNLIEIKLKFSYGMADPCL